MLGTEESEVNESARCLRADEERVASSEWRVAKELLRWFGQETTARTSLYKTDLSPVLDGRAVGKSSNSRPSECDSSWFAHFDSDKMMRHHRDVEKDLRYGLLEPEPARFRRSSAGFGS